MPSRPMTMQPKRVQQSQSKLTHGRGSPSERGYDATWRKLRDRFAKANPVCVRCRPLVKPMRIVDHIVPVHVAPHRRLDETNLQSLCHTCHTRKTNQDIQRYGAAP